MKSGVERANSSSDEGLGRRGLPNATVMTDSADVANTGSCCPPDNSHSLLSSRRAARPAKCSRLRIRIEHRAPPLAGYEHFPLRVFADGLADQSSPWINLLIVILKTGQKIPCYDFICVHQLSSRRFDHSWDELFTFKPIPEINYMRVYYDVPPNYGTSYAVDSQLPR